MSFTTNKTIPSVSFAIQTGGLSVSMDFSRFYFAAHERGEQQPVKSHKSIHTCSSQLERTRLHVLVASPIKHNPPEQVRCRHCLRQIGFTT